MRKIIFTGIVVLAIAAVAAFNLNLNSDKNVMSSLTLANVEALAQENGDLQTKYNRHPFPCTIYGNGKVKIAGGSILEVKGSLSFDGGIYCTDNGSATCSPVECAQLWQWIL